MKKEKQYLKDHCIKIYAGNNHIHMDDVAEAMKGFSEQQLEEKEGHYQGAYNGLKFKFDEAEEKLKKANKTSNYWMKSSLSAEDAVKERDNQIKLLNDALKELNDLVIQQEPTHSWKRYDDLITSSPIS